MATYNVWIGGSSLIVYFIGAQASKLGACDYGHKERAGGAAVVIEHNGKIICRDVIADLHTTEFRMMLTREWSDWNNGCYWWIQSVYVAPEYRRQGVYKSMYHAVCKDAKQQNIAQVRLYVDKTNTRGQKVYASLGMQESHYLIYETTL